MQDDKYLPVVLGEPQAMLPSDSASQKSLATLRREGVNWIKKTLKSESARKSAIHDLASALVCEELRRKEMILLKNLEEIYRQQIKMLQIFREHKIKEGLDYKRLQLSRSEMNLRTAINISKTKQILARPATQDEAIIQQAKHQLLRRKAQTAVTRHLNRACSDDIKKQTLHRAAFLKYVREHYPDMEAELMDDYDRRQFQFNQYAQHPPEEED